MVDGGRRTKDGGLGNRDHGRVLSTRWLLLLLLLLLFPVREFSNIFFLLRLTSFVSGQLQWTTASSSWCSQQRFKKGRKGYLLYEYKHIFFFR